MIQRAFCAFNALRSSSSCRVFHTNSWPTNGNDALLQRPSISLRSVIGVYNSVGGTAWRRHRWWWREEESLLLAGMNRLKKLHHVVEWSGVE